jgi:hypothetical protein
VTISAVFSWCLTSDGQKPFVFTLCNVCVTYTKTKTICRLRRPCGLHVTRLSTSVAQTLGPPAWIPLEAWLCVRIALSFDPLQEQDLQRAEPSKEIKHTEWTTGSRFQNWNLKCNGTDVVNPVHEAEERRIKKKETHTQQNTLCKSRWVKGKDLSGHAMTIYIYIYIYIYTHIHTHTHTCGSGGVVLNFAVQLILNFGSR